MKDAITRSQAHATFVIERTYPVPVTAVWHALSDEAARDQWFTAGDAFAAEQKHHDFRTGGQSTETGQWHGGPRSRFQSTYTDIVEPERIVFTYDMWADGRHLSTSVTTIALADDGDRTLLTYVEQGVHFDGLDTPEGREEGAKGLLDQLGTYLASDR
jgi:uncharacterized protein YndB with AHSA1/START domain